MGGVGKRIMDLFDDLIDRSRASPRHIVLAEGEDERIAAAAARAVADGIATVTLLGRPDVVTPVLAGAGADIRIVDPQQSPDAQRYGEAYYELRKHKGIDRREALEAIAQPLRFANMMVHMGDARVRSPARFSQHPTWCAPRYRSSARTSVIRWSRVFSSC